MAGKLHALYILRVCVTGEEGDVEVEAGGVEGPIVGMSISGFEVACGVESSRVPEAASEVGEKRQLRPELRDFSDEDGVLVD